MSFLRSRILFGTETGTALLVARYIAVEALRRGLHVTIAPCDDMQLENESFDECTIIVCSTTGQGEFPATMRRTWERLRNVDCPRFAQLRFAIFGLGDATYPKFNYVAKLLHKRLEGLGGTPLLLRGLGDEQDRGRYETALRPWLSDLWAAMQVAAVDPRPSGEFAWWLCKVVSGNSSSTSADGPSHHADATAHMTLKSVRRLTTADHFQDVRHFDFVPTDAESELKVAGQLTAVGQCLAVYPVNDADAVQRMLTRFRLQKSWLVTVHPAACIDEGYFCVPRASCATFQQPNVSLFHRPVEAFELFLRYVAINGGVTRSFLETLSCFARRLTSDVADEVVERLLELASQEHFDEFDAYATKEHRSFLEVLEDFPDVPIPLDVAVSHMGMIHPRLYSLSSAPSERPLSITVALLSFRTPYRRERRGHCSGFLCDLPLGSVVDVAITEPKCSMTTAADAPVPSAFVLVGPGTGIAPVRGFVRHFLRCPPIHRQQVVVFTGHRSRDKDFLYDKEWTEATTEAATNGRVDVRVFSAFSRDPSAPSPRYVQHAMVLSPAAETVYDAIVNKGGLFYICGNSKQMPADVESALQSIIERYGECDAEDAAQYIKEMKLDGRFQTDTWST